MPMCFQGSQFEQQGTTGKCVKNGMPVRCYLRQGSYCDGTKLLIPPPKLVSQRAQSYRNIVKNGQKVAADCWVFF